MDATTVEPDTVVESEPPGKNDINGSKGEPEEVIEEKIDEPITDESSKNKNKSEDQLTDSVKVVDSVDENAVDENSQTETKHTHVTEMEIETDDQKIEEPVKVDERDEKVDEKEKKNDDEVSDRQLRNSSKTEKMSSSDEEKVKDLNEDKKSEEKQSETPKERKRRYKNFSSSITKTPEEVVVKSKRKRLQSDKFCWRCHKESVEMHCSACPRSWHRKCIGGSPVDSVDNWICAECAAILKAENVESRSVTMAHVTVDQLCMMLKNVVERMRDYPGSEPFWKAVDLNEVTNYLDYVVKPMDLSLLESNVRSKLYGSTDAFMADAKWIQHNSIVFNTCGGVYADTLKLSNAAKQMIKVARQEVSEMEACPDCYAHGRNLPRPMQSWFIEPCQRPHTLVWAKLKGFPYWPAKAMPRLNGQGFVDVRFFGAHDRAWVSPKDMYLYSREPPTSFPRKRKQDLDDCVKEIERHCQKLAMVFGEFVFAPPKIQYNPQDPDQIKLLLPHYDPSQPASKLMGAAMRKRSIANKKSSPTKKKADEIDEDEDVAGPEPKRAKLDNAKSPNTEDKVNDSSPVSSLLNQTSNKAASPVAKRRNGFFSEKTASESKLNHHPKKLSAILPSRISKRRSANLKSTPEKSKSRESSAKSDSPVSTDTTKKVAISATTAKTVAPITIIKAPVKKPEGTSLLNKPTVNVAQQQQPVVFFVINNEKNAVKSVANSVSNTSTVVSTTTTTTVTSLTPPTEIKQEPRPLPTNSINSPALEESRREGRARKSFCNKVSSFMPQERALPTESRHSSYSSTPMVVMHNYQVEDRISYEMPTTEAGPISARLNENAHELARRMAQLMEESLKDVAQNNLMLQENSVDSYRAAIHLLQLKIEKLKWQHQEEITEMQYNYERKLKEVQASMEADMQRLVKETQKNADEQNKKIIEKTKKKQWCAMCSKEANFYCCWNTSYCDHACQQAHWPTHMNTCAQPAYQAITTNNAQIMPKLVVKNVASRA